MVLFEEDEISGHEWLSLAMNSGAYDFLTDSVEDIYTMEDGVSYKSKSTGN